MLHARLTAPVDGASLRAFRVLFGLTMAASTLRFLALDRVAAQLGPSTYHFAYPGLAFIAPLPRPLMVALLALMLVAALGLAAGRWPRRCALAFGLAFTYVELIDRAFYLNHYYLVSLLSWLLALVPTDRERAPALHLFVLRFQVAVVYMFAGLAKLQPDWLLEAQPLKLWLAARSDLPLLGPLLAEPLTAHVFSIAGALFDLTVVLFLLVRRTRRVAFAAALLFHALTGLLFPIGVFPWLMTACLTLFLPADWPRALGLPPARPGPARVSRPALAVLAVHCLVQLAVPVHQQLQRDSAWTSRGFDFAWRVMVAEKSGAVSYELVDVATGLRTRIEPRAYLGPDQERALARDPVLVWALGQHLADEARREGRAVQLFAHAFASLNGRPAQRLVDPRVAVGPGDPPPGWVLPLAP